jgi:hypothetical protein
MRRMKATTSSWKGWRGVIGCYLMATLVTLGTVKHWVPSSDLEVRLGFPCDSHTWFHHKRGPVHVLSHRHVPSWGGVHLDETLLDRLSLICCDFIEISK